MSRAKPGRRINKRHGSESKLEPDDEIARVAHGLEEYIVISDSSSMSHSSQSYGQRSRTSSSSSSSSETSRSSHQPILKAQSTAGSGGSVKSLEKEKRTWKMDDYYRIYSFKEYISSYLYLLHNGEWIKVYGSICGETLRVVKVPDTIAVQTYEPEPTVEKILSKELSPSLETLEALNQDEPLFIHSIQDSYSHVFPVDYTNEVQPPPPIPYTCFFRIDTYRFASSSYISANSWVHAVRLSAYEYGLLNVYFSFSLLRVVPYIRIWGDFEIMPFKTKRVKNLEWDGECKIKFGIDKEWSDFYCKISSAVYETVSKVEENSSKSSGRFSKLFHRKNSNDALNADEKPTEILVRPARMAFYSSSMECKKGMTPKFTLQDVIFVYALWPKTMHHVKSDAVTDIKIMGIINFGDDPSLESLQAEKDVSANSIFLQSSNTHESLHWLVAILGAFALNADLNSSDTNAAVWSSPPSDWGDLSLSLDEIAGLSGSVPLSNSFIEYAKLLSAKKGMLRNGMFSEWLSSLRDSIQTRKNYERKEVELKANALVLWIHKLKNGDIQLPTWVKSELNDKISEKSEIKREPVTSDSESGEDGSLEKKEKQQSVINFIAAGTVCDDITLGEANADDGQEKKSENVSDVSPFRRVSNAQRLAAKKFLTGLSESLPKVFEGSSDLPSNLWYQEQESRIKEWGDRAIPDQENSQENIQIYEANSLLEKESHAVKKSGLENFHIPEKQGPKFAENSLLEKESQVAKKSGLENFHLPGKHVPIFAENSLLDKTAFLRDGSQFKAEGPLLGQVQKDGNKPKLEGGLLGQMDLREKEFENFKKSGGYRATMLPPSADLSQAFQSQGLSTDSEHTGQSLRNSTQPNQIIPDFGFAVRNSEQALTNMLKMPHMDPRSSILAAPLDPRASLMGQPLDPRMSFIGQPIDPRISFIGQPLDPRFSFIPPPIGDPRFSLNSNEVNSSNVSSLQNEHAKIYTDQIRLNSIRSNAQSDSPSAKSSESENSDETESSFDGESGTESTSSESDASDPASSQGTTEALFAQLEDDKESIGSSSVTSSDEDGSENYENPTAAALNYGPMPYPGMFPYPPFGVPSAPGIPTQPPYPQFFGANLHASHVPSISNSRSSKSVSSPPGSDKGSHHIPRTASSESGTESDSSASDDELSAKKKPRSLLLPGKGKK